MYRAGFVEMEWQRQMNEAQSTGNQLLEAWMQDKLRVEWQHVYSFTSDLVTTSIAKRRVVYTDPGHRYRDRQTDRRAEYLYVR